MSNTKKNFFWNTLGSSFLSFNSLFLLIIVTRLNGLNDAGIFSFAFATAGIINFLALYSGRTYQISNLKEEFTDSLFVVTRYCTCLFALFVTLLFIVLNGYSLHKALIILSLCIVKCLEALSDVYYGILQKNEYLYIAGKSLTYKSLVSLFLFIATDLITGNLLFSCSILVVVNVGYLLFYDIPHAKEFFIFDNNFNNNFVIKLIKGASFTFLFTFIVMIIINLPRYFIDYFLVDSDQAIYGIISMPATFVMLLSQFILQPSLTSLTTFYKHNDEKNFNAVVAKICFLIFLSMIIIVPVAWLLGIPVLEIIYNVDLAGYVYYLLLVIVGSSFYAISNVFLNSLIIIDCNKEQFILQLIVLFLSGLTCFYLISSYGLYGGLISYFVILTIQFIAYFILYRMIVRRKFKEI